VALLDDLRARRKALAKQSQALLDKAAGEHRDHLTAAESAEAQRLWTEQGEIEDQIADLRDREQAERLAAAVRRPTGDVPREPVLRNDQSVYAWCRARGMFDQGEQELSFDRYLRGMATADWTGADQERALAESTVGAGGALVPTPLSATVIDLARNAMVTNRAGVVTVPMTSQTLKLARLTGEGSPGWKTEGAAITATADMTFDQVLFTARTLTRVVTLSVELFEDADPSSESVIANSFAKQLALELDRAVLRGSGTPPEPKGILNQTGVTLTVHGANGSVIGSPPAAGTMGWEFLAQAVGILRGANFEPNAQIMAPRTVQSLGLLRDTTNQYIAPPSLLAGIPRYTTKQVPITLTVGTSSDCSEVYTGDWSQCMVGIRTPFNIRFLGERYFADTLSYAFVAYLRADVQLSQPTAFNVDTGVRS
jgi:HK97 family phage major capsid protein